MDDKIHLYGTFHLIPADVIVTVDSSQFQGVVEQQLIGTLARYLFRSKLHFVGFAEVGAAKSYLKPLGTSTTSEDIEESGASLVLGGGAQWLISEKLWLGADLTLGSGTFQTSQFSFSTNLTL